MSQRHPLAMVAGAATLLAAFPLTTVYASFTWLFYTVIAVAVVVGTAMLVRTARGPVWAQVLAMMASLLLYLTLVFPSGEEIGRLIPTAATFRHFNELLVLAGQQIRDEAVPVPDLDGLLLLTTAGVGLVAVLVDLAAVGIRRPALAGLPMLAIYSVPVAVLPEGLSVLPFGFAAAGYLWLLVSDSVDRVRRFGRRFTGEGRDVDLWEPSPLSAAGRRLGVVGVVIAMLLPLALPGMTSGLLDRFGGGGLGGGVGDGPGGPGAAVNLTAMLKDNLVRDKAFDMVRVSTTDPTPYYLRFGIADQVTKDGFVSRAPASGTGVNHGLPEYVAPDIPGVQSQRYVAQIETVNFDMRLAPVYQQLVRTEGLDASWFFDASTNQVFSRRSSVTGKTYKFEFVRASFSQAALRTAEQIPPTDTGARELTAVPPVQEVSELVADLTEGKTTEYDKVRAIYDHFDPRKGFTYSLVTEPGTSGNAIVDFLAAKKGFCVQYAAAMAWLVRAAGYPARVAFGFTRGSGAQGGVYTLTNYNLHAWTEVLFPGFGWIPFDPTPSGSVLGSVPSPWAPDPTNPGAGGDEPPDVANPTAGPTGSIGPGGLPTDPGEGTIPGTGGPVINTWWLVGAAVLAFAVALMLTPALRRRRLRRLRRARADEVIVLGEDGQTAAGEAPPKIILDAAAMATARRDAHNAWAELLDTMVDFDVPVDPAETPRATADRLGDLPALAPPARGHAGLLASAEERARYARMPLPPDGLNEAVRATRAGFAERATRRQRLTAALMPRSVVLRWRAGWVGWVSRTVGAAGRAREALVLVSPRRLLTRGSAR